jgi:hypothetical protein
MNKKKLSTRLKIFGSILVAYIVVIIGAPQVFIANSSKIRPDFIARMRAVPQNAYALARYPFNSEARQNAVETAHINDTGDNNTVKNDLQYQSVAPGVYAAEDPANQERFIKIEKGTQIEVRYITLSDGRKVKVYVPVQ